MLAKQLTNLPENQHLQTVPPPGVTQCSGQSHFTEGETEVQTEKVPWIELEIESKHMLPIIQHPALDFLGLLERPCWVS